MDTRAQTMGLKIKLSLVLLCLKEAKADFASLTRNVANLAISDCLLNEIGLINIFFFYKYSNYQYMII
jgi:hypothetical protein